MDIFQVRFGLATNSSSTHSLVFLPENVQAVDHCGYASDEPDFGNFGWQYFTLTSTEGKMRYLAALLKERLYHELPHNIADIVIKSWLPDVHYDVEDSIDHQSFMFLPSAHGTEIPDEKFFNELKDYLLQDRLAILGGNDNETPSHYLDDGSAFNLPIPGSGVHGNNMVCRFDEKYGYWTIFNQEDGTKIRMRFGNNPEQIKPEKAYAPELVDLKITDFCPYGCPYCVVSETEILTPFGPKRIDEIKSGDQVYAFDECKKIRQEETVEQCHQRDYDGDLVVIELEDDSTLSLTSNHEVFTERGWVIAGEIEEGDELLKF